MDNSRLDAAVNTLCLHRELLFIQGGAQRDDLNISPQIGFKLFVNQACFHLVHLIAFVASQHAAKLQMQPFKQPHRQLRCPHFAAATGILPTPQR